MALKTSGTPDMMGNYVQVGDWIMFPEPIKGRRGAKRSKCVSSGVVTRIAGQSIEVQPIHGKDKVRVNTAMYMIATPEPELLHLAKKLGYVERNITLNTHTPKRTKNANPYLYYVCLKVGTSSIKPVLQSHTVFIKYDNLQRNYNTLVLRAIELLKLGSLVLHEVLDIGFVREYDSGKKRFYVMRGLNIFGTDALDDLSSYDGLITDQLVKEDIWHYKSPLYIENK